jgi:hypothetical protein
MSVTSAVRRDLAKLPKALAESGLAAVALAMAAELDGDSSTTSKSMCAGRLQDALRELRELAPPEEVKDGVDEIADQRAKRRSGGATAKG